MTSTGGRPTCAPRAGLPPAGTTDRTTPARPARLPSRLTAVCSGRKRPQSSNGEWLAIARLRRSLAAAMNWNSIWRSRLVGRAAGWLLCGCVTHCAESASPLTRSRATSSRERAHDDLPSPRPTRSGRFSPGAWPSLAPSSWPPLAWRRARADRPPRSFRRTARRSRSGRTRLVRPVPKAADRRPSGAPGSATSGTHGAVQIRASGRAATQPALADRAA